MSRRSLKRKRTLGYVTPPSSNAGPSAKSRGAFRDSQCGGDKTKFNGTRPDRRVVGTGRWLGNGGGVGETVTLPERK